MFVTAIELVFSDISYKLEWYCIQVGAPGVVPLTGRETLTGREDLSCLLQVGRICKPLTGREDL